MNKIVKDYIKELGYENIIDETHDSNVQTWLSWYKGKTKQHEFYVYNGIKKNKIILKSLNMASQSCGDLSDFFFNEKLEININKKKIKDVIDKVLMQNNFLYNCNDLMQYTAALGTGAIVLYLDNGKLRINYIKAPNVIILSTRENIPTEVLLWSEETTKEGTEIYINTHILDEEDNYIILNKKYLVKGKSSSEIDIPDELREIHTNSPLPKFGILKTAVANNLNINSPYGISVYANALDNILSIDRVFDSLDNEIALGRKRVYVSASAAKFNTDNEGNMTPVFDSNDIAYYQVPGEEGKDPVKESSFDLRIDQLTASLQAQLNLYTSKIGLGHNFYKFKDGETYVNTDNVMSANSDVFRKIKKQENIITNCLINVIYAIAELLDLGTDFDISIDYDDSIIEDTEAKRKSSQIEYNAKLISKAQYYRNVYNMDDKNAIKFAKKMNEEIQNETITDGSEFDLVE